MEINSPSFGLGVICFIPLNLGAELLTINFSVYKYTEIDGEYHKILNKRLLHKEQDIRLTRSL